MNAFVQCSKPGTWHRIAPASAFPDIDPDNQGYRIAAQCKAFHIPSTSTTSTADPAPTELDIDLPGRDLKDQVLVFKYRGKFHAVDHSCPHASFPLSQGTLFDIEDFGITLSAGINCPKHGWSFDLFTGLGDRGNYKLKMWEVQLRDADAGADTLTASTGDGSGDGDGGKDVWVWVRRKPRIG